MSAYVKLPISRKEILSSSYCVMSFHAQELARECKPGMFFELKADKQSQNSRLFKPISIYGVDGQEISFMIKVIGEGTSALTSLQAGEHVKLIGPLGNSFPEVERANVLLVSGGVGYPPLEYLRRNLDASNRITFLHGGSCIDDIFPCDQAYTLDGSIGKKGLVTLEIKEIIKEKNIDIVFSCGPLPMLKALQEIVTPITHYVSLEAFMACGVGVCHGCVVPVGNDYQRVCKEGPVFNAADVRWDEL